MLENGEDLTNLDRLPSLHFGLDRRDESRLALNALQIVDEEIGTTARLSRSGAASASGRLTPSKRERVIREMSPSRRPNANLIPDAVLPSGQ